MALPHKVTFTLIIMIDMDSIILQQVGFDPFSDRALNLVTALLADCVGKVILVRFDPYGDGSKPTGMKNGS